MILAAPVASIPANHTKKTSEGYNFGKPFPDSVINNATYYNLMRREDSLEKTLMLGKSESKRRRGRQRMRWLESIIEATNMNLTQL